MNRLSGATELLDGPLDDPATLRGNLRDLRRVNRLLGGAALSRWAIAHFAAPGAALRVLDVGTGGADIPAFVRGSWRGAGPPPAFTAVDSRPEVVAAARADTRGDDPGIELTEADGRALPWPDAAFDVGHASLVLHHLEPLAAVGFLRELARVTRLGVVINDLDRAEVHWLGAWLLSHLFTANRLSRNDAPLSVRRAYTVREMGDLLRVAGLRPVAVRRAPFRHRYAIVAVPAGRQ